ncbi:hypothetical protein LOD99_5907 [Oopsacas minuta]|uniref:Uncharacterized protein n=1 Tax=Oopsacas minuta TaxID=111878 RepID=A0AAV7JPX9_9METZ|nr:hypothetical protein LOD99_5907 [Oopsacas minuta]
MACKQPHSYGGNITESQPTSPGNEIDKKKTRIDKNNHDVSLVTGIQDTITTIGENSIEISGVSSEESTKMNKYFQTDKGNERIPSVKQPHSESYFQNYTLIDIILHPRESVLGFWRYDEGPQSNETTKKSSKPSNKQCVTLSRKQSGRKNYTPKITKEEVTKERNIFKMLQHCYTTHVNEIGFIQVKYNWPQRHLTLVQGLNLLVTCKNHECEQYMQGVVCPRGMFSDRNGYCPLDSELYKAKCPTCKLKITPDESFGFGFYQCSFQLTYMLMDQREYRMKLENSSKIFYFRRFSILSSKFRFMEAHISFEEDIV